ncbi:MAG: hypothetical protein Q7U40_06190, partial [Desulfatirhabdiaceae bacterium]|nr:hypothetical protein [Desulfatirhabdiaceae bacterium]
FEQIGEMFRVTAYKKVELPAENDITGEVTGEVRQEIIRIAKICMTPKSRKELMAELGLKHADHFREAYLLPALEIGIIEQTIPDKPTSRLQKYRLSGKGRDFLNPSHKGRGR